jgi:hypothetical protein
VGSRRDELCCSLRHVLASPHEPHDERKGVPPKYSMLAAPLWQRNAIDSFVLEIVNTCKTKSFINSQCAKKKTSLLVESNESYS